MNLRDLILNSIKTKGFVTLSDVQKETGFSQPYINRTFQQLRDEGLIVMIGRARNTRYVLASSSAVENAKKNILNISLKIKNKPGEVQEDVILKQIKRATGIFINLKKNAANIVDYAFTEMLNNAIEHSQSNEIEIKMSREHGIIHFSIKDFGIGIFNNIMERLSLNSGMAAIQDLLKGKLTTAEKEHSGEGIFFTSKAADNLNIISSDKKLIFNNIIDDIFVKDNKQPVKGTTVLFSIEENSAKNLVEIFNRFSDEEYNFSKTEVRVKLYKENTEYISRSQARRILTGLEKFKTIILDFKDVDTIGQAFADEIFRVWKNDHSEVKIIPENANENIMFMINRVR
ncbi:MAG: DUF4325 domain-containing protein [Ignavibacteriae bacterium]|nr:MAG: DUF4325 domain-containing protein [Ignavibacteriota bacterium]